MDLKSAYEKCVLDANDAEENLFAAKNELINAQTKLEGTREKIGRIREMLSSLEEVETRESDALETFTAKMNHCNNAYLLAQKNVEAAAKLEGIKDATRNSELT